MPVEWKQASIDVSKVIKIRTIEKTHVNRVGLANTSKKKNEK
jgi:hypothetical protein